jgi:site-specific DNA-methyltransferase (adenine-specific)
MYRIVNCTVERFCERYTGAKFHAVLCDPPYHLTSITERFGKPGSAAPVHAKDGSFGRLAKGFMGKSWDGGDIAFRANTWAGLAEHLHPGGFIMAFSSTRTFHRQAVAMEDAGLIIHPFISWAFGSGFPKAHQVYHPDFEGHRYGGQVIKPAIEPILVAQKPHGKKRRDEIIQTGAGAFNIAGSKIDGRWAANLMLTHDPACNGTCVPGCPVAVLDQQSGPVKAGGKVKGTEPSKGGGGVTYSGRWNRKENQPHEDEGTASRFFHQSDWCYEVEERIALADPFFYASKAKSKEKDAGLTHLDPVRVGDGRSKAIDNAYQRGETQRFNPHPTCKPIKLTQHLATLLLPPDAYVPRRLLVPFAGVGSEMIGAILAGWETVIGVEMTGEYIPVAQARLKYWQAQTPVAKAAVPAKAKKASKKSSPGKTEGAKANQPSLFEVVQPV